jgi:hypothetical protein
VLGEINEIVFNGVWAVTGRIDTIVALLIAVLDVTAVTGRSTSILSEETVEGLF